MANKKKVQKKKVSEGTIAVIVILIAAVLMIGFVVVVANVMSDGEKEPVVVNMTQIKSEINSHKATDFAETSEKTDYVKISVKDHGDIVIRLRPDIAPETVENFKTLVDNKFYNGLTFHRIYPNFMIQGGDPKGDGTGDSKDKIKGEFSSNGFTNDLKHVRGVISMARGNDADSASCQFFICHGDASNLDGDYASFGYVMAGLEVVDSITKVELEKGANSIDTVATSPVKDVVIEKIVFVKDTHNHTH